MAHEPILVVQPPQPGANAGPGTLQALTLPLSRAATAAPCEPGHIALKQNQERWVASIFAGIQPLDRELGESRHCPLCSSTVIRPVSVSRALKALFDDLLTVSPPRQITVKSVVLLLQWIDENLPASTGVWSPEQDS